MAPGSGGKVLDTQTLAIVPPFLAENIAAAEYSTSPRFAHGRTNDT